MKISLDFGGVIADYRRLWVQAVLELFGELIPVKSASRGQIREIIGETRYRYLMKCIYDKWKYGYELLHLVKGADVYLPLLMTEHQVQVTTTRCDRSLRMAQKFMHDMGLGAIHFEGVGCGRSKAPALKGFDVHVDDSPEKLKQLVGCVPNLFLFSWQYNEGEVPEGIVPVLSWADLYHRISDLAAAPLDCLFA